MPFRITSILVANDLSESAPRILRTAAALAALTEAELHVVHAQDSQGEMGEQRPQEEERLRAAHNALREHLRSAVPPSTVVTSDHVAAGRAYEVILARAAEVQADLLVIGPHRERPTGDRALGTTADRLVRTSDIPCLIVHAPLSLPLRSLLVPSDLSAAAQGALDMALVWGAALRRPTASGEETRLHVLHVHPPTSEGASAADEGVRAERKLHEEIAAAHERMGGVALLSVTEAVVQSADPADEILRVARAERADLLVLGTHGQGGLARTLIGGISSAVARRAECSVLLVPPALWEARHARAGAREAG